MIYCKSLLYKPDKTFSNAQNHDTICIIINVYFKHRFDYFMICLRACHTQHKFTHSLNFIIYRPIFLKHYCGAYLKIASMYESILKNYFYQDDHFSTDRNTLFSVKFLSHFS